MVDIFGPAVSQALSSPDLVTMNREPLVARALRVPISRGPAPSVQRTAPKVSRKR